MRVASPFSRGASGGGAGSGGRSGCGSIVRRGGRPARSCRRTALRRRTRRPFGHADRRFLTHRGLLAAGRLGWRGRGGRAAPGGRQPAAAGAATRACAAAPAARRNPGCAAAARAAEAAANPRSDRSLRGSYSAIAGLRGGRGVSGIGAERRRRHAAARQPPCSSMSDERPEAGPAGTGQPARSAIFVQLARDDGRARSQPGRLQARWCPR